MHGEPVQSTAQSCSPAHPARDRPPRRGAVHRPARPRHTQAGDGRDPRGAMVGLQATPEPVVKVSPHPPSGRSGRPVAGPNQRGKGGGGEEEALGSLCRDSRARGPIARALLESRHEVVAVITPRRARRRGRRLSRRRWGRWPTRRRPVLTPRRPRTGVPRRVACARAGLLPRRRVRRAGPPRGLDVPRHGWVNLHFSLLPGLAWRGARAGARSAPATRSPARRRSAWRRGWTPGRCSAWSPRPSVPATLRATLLSGSPAPGPG